MSKLPLLSVSQSSMILPVDGGVKVIWTHKDGTQSSAIYGCDGAFHGSMIHGGDYEVPDNIVDYIREII